MDSRCVRMVAVIGRDAGHVRWTLKVKVDVWRRAGLEVTHDFSEVWEDKSREENALWTSGTHPMSEQWKAEIEAMRTKEALDAGKVPVDDLLELRAKHMRWREETRAAEIAAGMQNPLSLNMA